MAWVWATSGLLKLVVGSLLCCERFFFGFCGFPLPSEINISKFKFDWVQDLPENHFQVSGASWVNINNSNITIVIIIIIIIIILCHDQDVIFPFHKGPSFFLVFLFSLKTYYFDYFLCIYLPV